MILIILKAALLKVVRLKSCFHTQMRCGRDEAEAQPAGTTPVRLSCDL